MDNSSDKNGVSKIASSPPIQIHFYTEEHGWVTLDPHVPLAEQPYTGSWFSLNNETKGDSAIRALCIVSNILASEPNKEQGILVNSAMSTEFSLVGQLPGQPKHALVFHISEPVENLPPPPGFENFPRPPILPTVQPHSDTLPLPPSTLLVSKSSEKNAPQILFSKQPLTSSHTDVVSLSKPEELMPHRNSNANNDVITNRYMAAPPRIFSPWPERTYSGQVPMKFSNSCIHPNYSNYFEVSGCCNPPISTCSSTSYSWYPNDDQGSYNKPSSGQETKPTGSDVDPPSSCSNSTSSRYWTNHDLGKHNASDSYIFQNPTNLPGHQHMCPEGYFGGYLPCCAQPMQAYSMPEPMRCSSFTSSYPPMYCYSNLTAPFSCWNNGLNAHPGCPQHGIQSYCCSNKAIHNIPTTDAANHRYVISQYPQPIKRMDKITISRDQLQAKHINSTPTVPANTRNMQLAFSVQPNVDSYKQYSPHRPPHNPEYTSENNQPISQIPTSTGIPVRNHTIDSFAQLRHPPRSRVNPVAYRTNDPCAEFEEARYMASVDMNPMHDLEAVQLANYAFGTQASESMRGKGGGKEFQANSSSDSILTAFVNTASKKLDSKMRRINANHYGFD